MTQISDELIEAKELAALLVGIEKTYEELLPIDLTDEIDQAQTLVGLLEKIHELTENMPELEA